MPPLKQFPERFGNYPENNFGHGLTLRWVLCNKAPETLPEPVKLSPLRSAFGQERTARCDLTFASPAGA
jgi:hypothetical protein